MFKPDIPFSRDDANRFLPWMVALMCGMAALMLCVGLTLGSWVADQQGTYSNSFSVQVPHSGDQQAQKVEKVLLLLESTEGLGKIKVLAENDILELVKPWLGEGEMIRHLPYPTVIDVELKEVPEDQRLDLAGIETALKTIDNKISLDTQEVWVEKFSRFSNMVQTALYVLALFVSFGLAGMMIFAARAAMKLHANTVQLLHTIGADDAYIARQFQQNALALALKGAVPGTLAAGVVYGILTTYASSMDTPLMNTFGMTISHVVMLILLPVTCAVISLFAVRMATLSQLRTLP